MSLNITEYSTVYKNPRYYCGPGPSVIVQPSGSLTVAFRRVPSWLGDGYWGHWHPATEMCLTFSDDLGRSWSAPQVVAAGNQCPSLDRLKDGTLLISTHRMEMVSPEIGKSLDERPGIRTTPAHGVQVGTCLFRSVNDGLTWSDPKFLEEAPDLAPLHPAFYPPLAYRGNVLEITDGRLLLSAYSIADPNCAFLFQSSNGGESWQYYSMIAAGFNETYLYETENGEIVAFMRAGGSDESILHASRSKDLGCTWSEPEQICRGYPACAVRLQSDNVLLVYGYRFEGLGVRYRLLSADCRLSNFSEEYAIRDDGVSIDLGYPDACLLPDGRALVVYYINRQIDAPDNGAPRYIESCVLEED
jgi:hypothetical protein